MEARLHGKNIAPAMAIFVYLSIHEIHVSPPGTTQCHGLLPIQEDVSPIERPAGGALRTEREGQEERP
jgi:hypothetical protein